MSSGFVKILSSLLLGRGIQLSIGERAAGPPRRPFLPLVDNSTKNWHLCAVLSRTGHSRRQPTVHHENREATTLKLSSGL